MSVKLNHYDDFDLDGLFRQDDDEASRTDGKAQERLALRRLGGRVFKAYIKELETRGLLNPVEPDLFDGKVPRLTTYVVLRGIGLDPGPSAADTSTGAVTGADMREAGGDGGSAATGPAAPVLEGAASAWLCRKGSITWGLLKDQASLALMDAILREQEAWDFRHRRTFDAVVRVIRREAAGAPDPPPSGGWDGSTILVEVKALRVAGQLAGFQGPDSTPVIPGVEVARQRLVHSESIRQAREIEEPRDLLHLLFTSLVENDFTLFRSLWLSGISDSNLQLRFTQFKRQYETFAGKVAFGAYDSTYSPQSYPQCGGVRVFIDRTAQSGTVTRSPLWFQKEAGQWKLEKGII